MTTVRSITGAWLKTIAKKEPNKEEHLQEDNNTQPKEVL
jgi:hypothetical protein